MGFVKNGKRYTDQSGLTERDIDGLVEIRDYTQAVLSELDTAVARALEKIGLVAEGYAKRLCAVDTGRLRNSITHTTDGEATYIGTNVEYAAYVEMGTENTRAQPYLKPAGADHMNLYKRMLESELRG